MFLYSTRPVFIQFHTIVIQSSQTDFLIFCLNSKKLFLPYPRRDIPKNKYFLICFYTYGYFLVLSISLYTNEISALILTK